MFVKNTGLLEQRNEWPVSCLDEHELQRVAVECDALQRRDDCMKECDQRLKATIILEKLKTDGRRMRTVANAVKVLVGEDAVVVVVGPVTSLLNESGRKTVGIGLVVS
jgi:hypothetical protein